MTMTRDASGRVREAQVPAPPDAGQEGAIAYDATVPDARARDDATRDPAVRDPAVLARLLVVRCVVWF